MQRNGGPTFVSSATSIQADNHCCPVHVSTWADTKRNIKKRQRKDSQRRPRGSELRYRHRQNQAALRIAHSPSPKPQECAQRSLQADKLDNEAYTRVEECFRTERLKLGGRILRKRLNHELDLGLTSVIKSLDAILVAADTVFFCRRLHNHVTWRWSCDSDHGFATEFVGTTTPLYSEDGVRTEIVLSKPLLQSGEYSSNLLLSAFLHELVHCYLFISCGSFAEANGGHTPAFQKIVSLIQSWLGNPRLQLCSMRADLNNFLPDEEEQHEDGYCSRTMEVDAIYYGTEDDPAYSDFSNSPVWAGDSSRYLDELNEVVQPELVITPESSWMLTEKFVPARTETSQSQWVDVSWADTPRIEYVSRQELAGAIEGSSACLPILVE